MTTTKKLRYKRIMLKFSGEALMGKQGFGIDPHVIEQIAQEIKPLIKKKLQLGIIIGGGNFFRGAKLDAAGISRVTADHLGMVATMLNALAMRDIFEHLGIATKVMSALPIDGIIERYDRSVATKYLDENYVLVFASGTGNPLVTTDTALCLRGVELNADLLLKATNVDGVYSADPQKNSKAKLFSQLTYKEILDKELAVMDLAAFCLCRDHNMNLRIFNMHKKGALLRIMQGSQDGTMIQNDC